MNEREWPTSDVTDAGGSTLATLAVVTRSTR
jgi:hypothetical protein